MTRFSDETLMAYVDGELDAKSAAEVEAALDDPAVRDRIDVFRRAQFWSARAFDEPMHQDVPERLLRAVHGAADQAKRGADRAPTCLAAAQAVPRPPRRGWVLALAASVALAVGLAAGWQIFRSAPEGATATAHLVGPIDPRSPLHAALETSPSAVSTAWASADGVKTGEIVPVLTFRATDGRYCREFEMVTRAAIDAEKFASAGVACRTADGIWHAEVLVAARPPVGSEDRSLYAPAAESYLQLIDRYLEGIMEDQALDADLERSLIESGWR